MSANDEAPECPPKCPCCTWFAGLTEQQFFSTLGCWSQDFARRFPQVDRALFDGITPAKLEAFSGMVESAIKGGAKQ